MASLIGTGPNLPQYDLPQKMTDILNTNPWNQCFMSFAVFNAARIGFTTLQELEGNSAYQNTIDLYEHIAKEALKKFQSHSDPFMLDGTTPFLAHAHGPGNNAADGRNYNGHTLNGTEDIPHSGSTAWNLLFIYDCDGDEVGASDGLLTGFINCMNYLFDNPYYDDSQWVVANRTYSPWEYDKESIENPGNFGTLGKVQEGFDGYSAFNPDFPVKADSVGDNADEMYLNYSRWIYQKRFERSQEVPSANESPVIDANYVVPEQLADVRRPYSGPIPKILSYGWPRSTWSIVTAPASTTIDPDTGVVSWEHPTTEGSPHSFQIRLSNTEGQQDISWNLTVETVSFSMGLDTLDWNAMTMWDGNEPAVDPDLTYAYRGVGNMGPLLQTGVDYYEFQGGSLWLDTGRLQLPSENDNTTLVHELVLNGGDFYFPRYRRWTVKGHWTLNKDTLLHNNNNNACVLDLVGIQGDKRLTIYGGHDTDNRKLTINNSTSTGSYTFNGQTIPNASAIEGFTGTLVLGGPTNNNQDAGILIAFDADIVTPEFGLEMWQATNLHTPQLQLDHDFNVTSVVIYSYDDVGLAWVENILVAGTYTWANLDGLGFGDYFTNTGGTLTVADAGPDTDPPTPDPMTWASVPAETGTTSISMTADTASDPSGVEYFFECLTVGGNDSGWQSSPTYEDTGLQPGTQYTYRVKARDLSTNQNETAWSTSESATTETPDTTAPTPDPMTWAAVPAATSDTAITMTADTASDPSGVEYFFECLTVGGHDSGWQSSPTYEDTGLQPGTQYTYRVKARDLSPNQNETAWSTSESATTQASAPHSDTLTVTDGWSEKDGKTFVEDGKVYVFNSSDDDRWDVEKEYYISLQFSNISFPAGATISSVTVYCEHYEEGGFSSTDLEWRVGAGWPGSPATWATFSPAPVHIHERNETVDSWDVSSFVNTIDNVNQLEFYIKNNNKNKKSIIDHVYVVVEWSE
jgi:hypothetical protein